MATEINFESAENETPDFDIVETKEWKDKNSGMTVLEQIPLQTASNDPLSIAGEKTITRYGKAHIQVPGMGPMAFQFIFPEEFGLTECFENFEKYAEMALAEMENEANNKIEIPSGVNADALRV